MVHQIGQTERPRQALWLGWCFGFGHFLVGLYWIAIAFFTDPERFGALALPAVVLLCAWLALYPGLAAWFAAVVPLRSASARALTLALAWTAMELLRGVFIFGFPWNLIGYAWANTPVSQMAALTGIWGLSLLTVAAAGLPAALLESRRPGAWIAAGAALLLIGVAWAGGLWRLQAAPVAEVPGVALRLVQANVAQHHKWDPELRAQWFRRHLELSAAAPGGATHVIWPESATPYAIEDDVTARRMIAGIAPAGGLVLTGGDRFDLSSSPPRAWNSLLVLDPEGDVLARYAKRELVPFGEYLPLRDVLGRLGLEKLTRGSIDFEPGPGPATVTVPGLPPFSPLICYEVIFPGRVVDQDDRPAWLLNITNDAWFGRSSGPYQHVAMARLRAIEQGLPLVRAANTGISAVIDPYGRELARLDLDQMGVIDAALPQPLPGPTLFALLGPLPLILLASVVLAAAACCEIRARTWAAKG